MEKNLGIHISRHKSNVLINYVEIRSKRVNEFCSVSVITAICRHLWEIECYNFHNLRENTKYMFIHIQALPSLEV